MKKTENYSEDEKYMSVAIELAKKGYGYTAPNPVVGAVIVKDGCIIGQGYHEKWRTSRGAECVGFLQPVSRRRHDLCNVGTLLSSRKAATMHRCHHRSRYQPGSDRFRGSQSIGGWKRNPDFKGSWNTGNRTCVEGRMRRIKSGIFPLHPDWPPLCDHEIRHDYGWKDRRLYRCFQMGDRGRSQASCT